MTHGAKSKKREASRAVSKTKPKRTKLKAANENIAGSGENLAAAQKRQKISKTAGARESVKSRRRRKISWRRKVASAKNISGAAAIEAAA